ncbi:MAG: phosphoglycerate mutase, partial [Gemmatimonadota bacterium]|nr:phosphoglycerate mutase [Gemmatimonadota bacterium]
MRLDQIAAVARGSDVKVALLVMDGLGGLPLERGGKTELEAARTPHLDDLVRTGSCGLQVPVAPGITPGSGPGHLALFGYDPLVYETGRGVLEALGIEFPLEPGDIAVRANFSTVDPDGVVTDRRAGRIPTDEAEPLAERLAEIEVEGAGCYVRHVKEHRFLLVLRPDAPTGDAVADTDPGRTGVEPLPPVPLDEESEATAWLLNVWLEEARERLAGEPRANMALLRGVSSRPSWPGFEDVFGMRALAIAAYPMYRGVARLVGMEAMAVDDGAEPLVAARQGQRDDFDFLFRHYKA